MDKDFEFLAGADRSLAEKSRESELLLNDNEMGYSGDFDKMLSDRQTNGSSQKEDPRDNESWTAIVAVIETDFADAIGNLG